MGVEILYNTAIDTSIQEECVSTSSKILDEVFEVLEQDRVVEEVAQAIEKQCIESSFMAQDLKLSEDQIKLLKQNLAKIFFTIMTKKKNDFLNDLKKELNKNGQDGVKIEDTFIFRIKQILAKTLSNTLDIIGEQFKREYSFQSTVDEVKRIVDNKTGQNIGFRYQAVHYGKAVLAPNANLISFTTDIANCFEKGIMKGEVNENKKTPSAEKKVVDVTEEQIKNVVNSTVKEETKTNIDVTVVS